MKIETQIQKIAKLAKKASRQIALVPIKKRNKALQKMAKALIFQKDFLITENKKDLKLATEKNYPKALVDRLTLNAKRILAMAQCLSDTAGLEDPTGVILNTIKRPNGLVIEKVSTPIGVIGIIYESRPNVTSDCIGLCLKSGNSVILKGGKESLYSNKAIFLVLREAMKAAGLPVEAIQLISSTDRQAVCVLLKLNGLIDLIIPRGGEGLIRFVAENSNIPVVKHYKGICHIYVSRYADLNLARKICLNAKVQRPGVCNAVETLLVHKNVASAFLPKMIEDLKAAGVEIRGCSLTRGIVNKGVKRAVAQDWQEEYLDLVLSIKVVSTTKDAIEHINVFGSHHSEAIISKNKKDIDQFMKSVDSACLYSNASTRFTDGYEFGFGAEVGISTDKLHARGPMALEGLTTYKYIISGTGQIRT